MTSGAVHHLDANLPQAKNPASGWIATANNDIDGSALATQAWTAGQPPPSPYLYATTDLGFRHQRIAERLTAKSGGYALDDMTSIQADTTSEFAKAIVPGAVAWLDALEAKSSAVSAAQLTAAVDALRHWGDAATATGDPGPWTTPSGLTATAPASAFASDPGGRSAAATLRAEACWILLHP